MDTDLETTTVACGHARVGLLGNPSDLYGGAGLGFAIAEFGATARIVARAPASNRAAPLLEATWRTMRPHVGESASRGAPPLAIESNVPFQSGLAGSSAIVVAALRAWAAHLGWRLSRSRLAEIAWRVEQETLGVRAGPLDRLVQAHEGLIAMEFATPWAADAVRRLDPASLPPLLLAISDGGGRASGDVHAPIFERWKAGDPAVAAMVEGLAENARRGIAALEQGDHDAFLACIDRNLDLRGTVFEIEPADRDLIQLGRSLGAAAKLPGSGGAVLLACREDGDLARVESACASAGITTVRPIVQAPVPRVRAVFLAAGFGTRLGAIARRCAKPLLEISGEPLMTRVLRQAIAAGATDGVVVTNRRFHADFLRWRDAVECDLPLEIVDDGATSNETRLGAVRDLALALREGTARLGDEDVDAYLVLGCDNLFEFDLRRMVDRFAASGCGQLLVRRVPTPVPPAKYSEVVLAANGRRVARFREKPADPQSDLSAIAAYLLPADLPGLVDTHLAEGGAADAPGHLLARLTELMPFEAHRLDGEFLDIGTPADLERARARS